jgi:hypothetical protein
MLAGLKALHWGWKLLGALALIAGLWGGFELWKKSIYDAGYADATAACKARADEQEDRIEEVRVRTEAEIEALERELEAARQENDRVLNSIMDDTTEALLPGAAPDPDGDQLCLGPERVLRLDAIR